MVEKAERKTKLELGVGTIVQIPKHVLVRTIGSANRPSPEITCDKREGYINHVILNSDGKQEVKCLNPDCEYSFYDLPENFKLVET